MALAYVGRGLKQLRLDQLASEDADDLQFLLGEVTTWLRDSWRSELSGGRS